MTAMTIRERRQLANDPLMKTATRIKNLVRDTKIENKIIGFARRLSGVPSVRCLEANVWDRTVSRETFRRIARQVLDGLRSRQVSIVEVLDCGSATQSATTPPKTDFEKILEKMRADQARAGMDCDGEYEDGYWADDGYQDEPLPYEPSFDEDK